MKVDHCVCIGVTFEDLKVLAKRERLDFAALRARTRCCSACTLCEPYVRRMLETGETEFILDRAHPAPVGGQKGVAKPGTSKGEPGTDP